MVTKSQTRRDKLVSSANAKAELRGWPQYTEQQLADAEQRGYVDGHNFCANGVWRLTGDNIAYLSQQYAIQSQMAATRYRLYQWGFCRALSEQLDVPLADIPVERYT